ncbi:MAG: ribosome assembly RNA-binding protein YhbY [Clostridiales bacterium]|nr:ribosome assembly RNA-binding protein YhbY [Clostridiales bacterium]
MLTSKQRAFLKSKANGIETIFQIGKGEIGENLIKQVKDALKAREIIKLRVLENSLYTPAEAAAELTKAAECETVQVIGTRFVLYKESKSIPKEKRIELPK